MARWCYRWKYHYKKSGPIAAIEYSLESGECLTAPEVQLQPHGVRVVGDRIEVQLTS